MREDHAFKTYREQRGWSQSELGIKLGLDPSHAQSRISHYESWRRSVPIDLAYRFVHLVSSASDVVSLEAVYPLERFCPDLCEAIS